MNGNTGNLEGHTLQNKYSVRERIHEVASGQAEVYIAEYFEKDVRRSCIIKQLDIKKIDDKNYLSGRVEGSYYTSPLSVKSGRARFRASSFRKS